MELPETPATEKTRLRAELVKSLAAVDPETRRCAAIVVAEQVLALPELAAATRVFVCLSFGDELDTWGLVDRLLDSAREVFVPRSDPRDGRIHVHRYPCPLATLSFGLRQPGREVPEVDAADVDATLDVALVAGLGFDRRGYRLGYGRGYFDRFLAGRPFPAIGLAFAAQLRDQLPVAPHDVPMTAVVTEAGIVRR